MEKREGREHTLEKKEMSLIRKDLDLDNNFTRKFGLLKKGCVLYFYGRYNDAFDEVNLSRNCLNEETPLAHNASKAPISIDGIITSLSNDRKFIFFSKLSLDGFGQYKQKSQPDQ